MSLQPPVPHSWGKICKKRPNFKKIFSTPRHVGKKLNACLWYPWRSLSKLYNGSWVRRPKGRANMAIYCGIIIVRVGPKFVVSFDNPWPRIYIPTIVISSICLIFIKFIPITIPTKLHYHKPGKFLLPTSIGPHK